jgi:hypothetical protein
MVGRGSVGVTSRSFYAPPQGVNPISSRVAARYILAKSTQNVDIMKKLIEAVAEPLNEASRNVHSWQREDKDTSHLDTIARELSRAAKNLLDVMLMLSTENERTARILKTFEAKLRNFRKMLQEYIGKETWEELKPIIAKQGTKTEWPSQKFGKYRDLLLGILKATDTEVEGTVRVGPFNVALINTSNGGEWDAARLEALRSVVTDAIRALTRIGLGDVAYGTLKAYPTSRLPASVSSGFAVYNITRDDIGVSIDMGDVDETYRALVHELGHRAYFQYVEGRGRTAWAEFFESAQGAPDVDSIIHAWEDYVANSDKYDSAEFTPYFAQYLKKTGKTDLLMWLEILVRKLGIKDDLDAYGRPKKTKGNTPGLAQLKARKGEAKAFLYPVTAYSATNADELFAEVVSHLAVDGPGRIPEIVLDAFKRTLPSAKVAQNLLSDR